MADIGQPYTKGGITFQRTTEGLRRVDKPKKTVQVGIVSKDGGGETTIAPTSSDTRRTKSGKTITTATYDVQGTRVDVRDGKAELLTTSGGVVYRRQPQVNVPSQTTTGGLTPSASGASQPSVTPSTGSIIAQGMYGKYSPESVIASNNALAFGTYGGPKLPSNEVEKAVYVQQVNQRIAAGELPKESELKRTYQYEKELQAKQDALTAIPVSSAPRTLVAGESANVPRGFKRFGFGFGEGYRNAGETLRLPVSATGVGAQVGAVVRGAQFFAGAAAPGAGSALSTSRAGVTGARLLTAARATKAGAVGTDILVGTGLAVGAGEVARKRYEFMNLDSFERQALKNIDYKQAMRAGSESYLAQNTFVGSRIVSGLPGSQYFISQSPSFRAGVRENLIAQGVPSYNLPTAVSALQTRTQARASGEAVEALFISRSSEVLGRRLVSQAFPAGTQLGSRAGWQVFKTTAPRIAVAGAYEGAAMYGSQTFARGESFDPVQAAIYTGIGGSFAGVFGGTIAGTAVSRKGISKALLGGAYVTDPFEYPGDVFASATSRVPEPVLSKVVTGVPVFTSSPTKTQTPVNLLTGNPVNIVANIQSTINIPSTTTTPTPTSVSSVNIFDISLGSFAPVSPITPTPVSTPSVTPVQTPVQTPVTTPVNVNVPIVQPNPQLPILPFIPSFDAGGFGMGSVGKAKRAKYLNEVQVSQRALKKFLGNFDGVL